jgi:phosphatidylglycerol:prolipoprotein diacylglycerol transferase
VIDLTPSPLVFSFGPLTLHWYGVAYAVGLAAAYLVIRHEARWRGLDVHLLPNGMIVVAVAALVGGRLYHVIDQWQLYRDDPLKIVLPPYSGLGVYGGIITGTVAAVLYARWKHQPFLRWADAVAPGLFVMQAIARWGNFFNQELYGAPTNLPWGIAIQCMYRTQGYACPPGSDPAATLGQHFHPMFLYESISGLLGALVLIWLSRRFVNRLRPGDLLLVFFIWYGAVRFVVESLKADNWLFFGVPTAQVIAAITVIGAAVLLVVRHARQPGTDFGSWRSPGRGPGSGARESPDLSHQPGGDVGRGRNAPGAHDAAIDDEPRRVHDAPTRDLGVIGDVPDLGDDTGHGDGLVGGGLDALAVVAAGAKDFDDLHEEISF